MRGLAANGHIVLLCTIMEGGGEKKRRNYLQFVSPARQVKLSYDENDVVLLITYHFTADVIVFIESIMFLTVLLCWSQYWSQLNNIATVKSILMGGGEPPNGLQVTRWQRDSYKEDSAPSLCTKQSKGEKPENVLAGQNLYELFKFFLWLFFFKEGNCETFQIDSRLLFRMSSLRFWIMARWYKNTAFKKGEGYFHSAQFP